MTEPTTCTFSGHETFPFRYPWLKKGYDAIGQDPSVFQKENAITTLGVGKNMVRSIRHWCLAARLIEEDRIVGEKRAGLPRPSALGKWLLDEEFGRDPYLEDPATLWLLHWQIATNARRATTWYWAFSHYNQAEFTIDSLAGAIHRWTQTLAGKPVALSSIRRDVEVFVHTYLPTRSSRYSLVEDSIGCPLVDLRLLEAITDGRTFRFRRGSQEDLPDGVLIYATVDFWDRQSRSSTSMSISDLSRLPGSPGRILKIDESSMVDRFERLHDLTDGNLRFDETAGLKQVFRDPGGMIDPLDFLGAEYPAARAPNAGCER